MGPWTGLSSGLEPFDNKILNAWMLSFVQLNLGKKSSETEIITYFSVKKIFEKVVYKIWTILFFKSYILMSDAYESGDQ